MRESPIFVRTYDLLLWLLPQATKFERAHRFGLGERVTRRALDFQETLITAALRRGADRQASLIQADEQLVQLRSLAPAVDLTFLIRGKYTKSPLPGLSSWSGLRFKRTPLHLLSFIQAHAEAEHRTAKQSQS